MRVVEYPAGHLSELARASGRVHVLAAWAPNLTRDIDQIVAAYDTAHPGRNAVVITDRDFESALETFWLQADEIVDGWVPAATGRTAYAIPADRVVHLQKNDSGGDHDVFTVRAGPCSHRKFFGVHHAEKGFKGVERMYGVTPKAIYKCSEPGCSCWRATFD